jgi:hypothetical protein
VTLAITKHSRRFCFFRARCFHFLHGWRLHPENGRFGRTHLAWPKAPFSSVPVTTQAAPRLPAIQTPDFWISVACLERMRTTNVAPVNWLVISWERWTNSDVIFGDDKRVDYTASWILRPTLTMNTMCYVDCIIKFKLERSFQPCNSNNKQIIFC